MTTLRLVPFTALDDIDFGIGAEALVARLGPSRRQARNAAELDEYDYGHSVFRCQDGSRLEEITRRAPELHPDLAGLVRWP